MNRPLRQINTPMQTPVVGHGARFNTFSTLCTNHGFLMGSSFFA